MNAEGPSPGVTLLHRDEHLVAVAKPSGLLVHRGWAQDEVVLMGQVRDHLGQRVHPLHRLDRGTSGVVLFALDPQTAAAFQRQLQAQAVEKRYLSLVRGVPPESGTIDHPVPKAPKSKERRDAVTDFARLAVAGRYALVEARPRTGRLHQVRRHLKHRSWPILGDVNYGKGEHNRHFRERYGLHRLALHAFELSLEHPVTGRALTIRSSPPGDLADPLRRLGLEPSFDDVLRRLGLSS